MADVSNFFFRLDEMKARELSHSDIEEAKKWLLIVADYLDSDKPAPKYIRQILADAFRDSVKNPEKYDPDSADTGKALLTALNLRPTSRPKAKVLSYDVHNYMSFLPREYSQNKKGTMAARKFNISKSTAIKIYKDYEKTLEPTQEELEELARMYEEEGENHNEILYIKSVKSID